MKSTLKNMVLVLFCITLVCSAAVGFVYEATKGPIDAAKAAKITQAIALVVPEFTNDPGTDRQVIDVDSGQVVVYTAKNGDQVAGYAVETFTNNGFGGQIKLMAGFLPDGTIYKVETLQHAETPGLGNKIERSKSDFSVQFEGKNPATFRLAVKKDGGDVDAITASTISSRAYVDALIRAYNTVQSITNPQNHE